MNPSTFHSQLLEKYLLSPDTASFIFAVPAGVPFEYFPGDAVQIVAEIDGKPVKRFYTPIPVPGRPEVFELIIKRYEQGCMSRHIHDGYKLGDAVEFRGPIIRPHHVPGSAPIVNMVAGGTGLTPMLAILRRAFERNEAATFYLIFANKTVVDIISFQELNRMAATHANLKLTYVLQEPLPGWAGETGYVTADIMQRCLAPKSAGAIFYFCGPPPMLKAIRPLAESLGFAHDDILLP
jgi:cytochrome-b5 reductase